MKHEISVRKTEDDELMSKECFMCDIGDESYALHLSELVFDISQTASVNSVSEAGNVITIDTNLDQKEILSAIKSLFSSKFCYVRYVGIQ